MQPVNTIGYQGKDQDTLVAELQAAGVDLLLDIRRKPMSRKPGFSRKALSERLPAEGIEYRHMVDLGMAPDLFGFKDSKDHTPILKAYRERIAEYAPFIDEVAEMAQTRSVCLMCFEHNAADCHRSVVADYLREHHHAEIINL